jgi:site-specific DNA recombinase
MTIIPKKKAVVYARFSSSNQREESIDGQLRACNKWAEENGYYIIRAYTDHAKSATTDERPQFQQMIKDSKSREFDVVIVHKLDRFARNRYDSFEYKRRLKLNGVTVTSVTEKLDGSPESALMESILEGMNEFYSKNLAREVMKGMKETAYQCKHTGGYAPLGYDVDPITKKYIINEDEATIVRLIFDLHNKGYGYKKILAILNEKGYKTKFGNDFSASSIKGILTNEKYTGVYIYNQKKEKDDNNKRNAKRKPEEEIIRIEGGMPAIINESDFNKSKYLICNNSTNSGKESAKEDYLCSGLLYCGCGSKIHGNRRYCGRDKTLLITYRCSNRAQQRGCNTKEINKVYLDNYVMDAVYRYIFDAQSIESIVQKLKAYRDYNSVKNKHYVEIYSERLEEISNNIANLINLAMKKQITSDSIKDKLSALEQEKVDVELHIQALKHNLLLEKCETLMSKAIADSKSYFKYHRVDKAKYVIGEYIDKIVVDNNDITIYFKVNIPDDNMELQPLVVGISRADMYKRYRAVI